ncbi:MAG: hypothetical protein NTW87_15590 [Planctomycetota bacterium]|nr:hypothetical protein [Planctomycetota bacterium]
MRSLHKRLQPVSVVAWRPVNSTVRPPTEAELAQARYKVSEESGQGVLVQFEFARSSFARRDEIRDFFLDFFEAQVSAFAKEAGFAPLRPQDKRVRHELLEK